MAMVPYGPAIHDAIERGDIQTLKTLLKRAKNLQSQQGDLGKAITAGDKALKKVGAAKLKAK